MSELHDLAAELMASGGRTESRVRGTLGKAADRVRDTARGMASAKGWSQESQANIYARTGSRDRDPEAFVFGTGAVFFQEVGTSRHGPNPVLGPALDRHADEIDEMVIDAIGDLL